SSAGDIQGVHSSGVALVHRNGNGVELGRSQSHSAAVAHVLAVRLDGNLSGSLSGGSFNLERVAGSGSAIGVGLRIEGNGCAGQGDILQLGIVCGVSSEIHHSGHGLVVDVDGDKSAGNNRHTISPLLATEHSIVLDELHVSAGFNGHAGTHSQQVQIAIAANNVAVGDELQNVDVAGNDRQGAKQVGHDIAGGG